MRGKFTCAGKMALASKEPHSFPEVAGQPFGLRVDLMRVVRLATSALPLWTREFETAPTFVVASFRKSLPQLPDAADGDGDEEAIQPQHVSDAISDSQRRRRPPPLPAAGPAAPVVVGTLSGSLFALPVVTPPTAAPAESAAWEFEEGGAAPVGAWAGDWEGVPAEGVEDVWAGRQDEVTVRADSDSTTMDGLMCPHG